MSRKLDAAIAEMLYDVRIEKSSAGDDMWLIDRPLRHTYNTQGSKWMTYPLPHYSTDGNAMLKLDREMRERGWYLTGLIYYSIDRLWEATYENFWKTGKVRVVSHSKKVSSQANEEPLVRALAAYHALTGKEWTE